MKAVSSEDLQKKELCSERINSKRQACFDLKWNDKENCIYILCSVCVTFFLSYFFYRSVWALIPLSGVGILFYMRLRKKGMNKKKEELTVQFRDCILSVSASLQAGYSVENAFMESMQDMEVMHGRDSVIYKELMQIRRGLHINISLEELLTEFGYKSRCEEILQFAEVFSIAKRSGGGIPEIIRNSAELISRKISLKQEISILISGKQMELTIMKCMPFAILCYVGSANRGYFDCLYHNIRGIAIMTGCLIIYILAYVFGEKIMMDMAKHL